MGLGQRSQRSGQGCGDDQRRKGLDAGRCQGMRHGRGQKGEGGKDDGRPGRDQRRALRTVEIGADPAVAASFRQARARVTSTWLDRARQGLPVPDGDRRMMNALLIGAAEGAAILGPARVGPDERGRIKAGVVRMVRAVLSLRAKQPVRIVQRWG